MTDTTTDSPKLLTDAPASTDLLGFKPHAERLAALIQKQIPDKASFVIGIEGEWGEGKSSFINLLKAAFPTEETDEARPTIVDFNPWWFEGSDQLLRHFFDELLGQIDRSGRWTAPARKFMRGLAGLLDGGGKAAQLVSDPGVIAAGEAAEKAGGLLKKLGAEKTRSAQVLKASSKHVLEAQRFKTVVFIDDLDRLPAREIVELFRVIKAVADLPNIVYVIAYDRAIVASALDEIHPGRGGEAYLEKIVQLPYRLPKPTDESWYRYHSEFFSQLPVIDQYLGDDKQEALSYIIRGLLLMPRDAKRLYAVLVQYADLPEKLGIDVLDFLFLEGLRLKYRVVWEELLVGWAQCERLVLGVYEAMAISLPEQRGETRNRLENFFPQLMKKAKDKSLDDLLVALSYFTALPFREDGGHSRAASQPPKPYRLVLMGYPKEVNDMQSAKLEIMLRTYRQLVTDDNT